MKKAEMGTGMVMSVHVGPRSLRGIEADGERRERRGRSLKMVCVCILICIERFVRWEGWRKVDDGKVVRSLARTLYIDFTER